LIRLIGLFEDISANDVMKEIFMAQEWYYLYFDSDFLAASKHFM